MYPYERLAASQVAYQLTLATYRATSSFPKHELFGHTSQSRRAAVSLIANIAEGSAKRGAPELRRYLNVALGSMADSTNCPAYRVSPVALCSSIGRGGRD
jgi:four helix bundle protein